MDKMKEQVRPEALTRIQSSLVLEQIAKEENFEITEDDVNAEIEKMAKAYGMEADKLKEYVGDDEKESMKRDIAIEKAVQFIMDNVKERAKAKTKKEKEAEATVPSKIFNNACCTPSPDTSLVMDTFSDFFVILSISSM